MSVNLGSAYAELKLKKDGFSAGLVAATNELSAFKTQSEVVAKGLGGVGSALTNMGKTLTTAVTVPVAGLTAAAIKTTATFDTSMSRVQALSGATAAEFQRLRDTAIEMGAKTAFSASESADALSYMALAGWDTNQMIAGLPGVLDLAASSQMDLAQASDMVTDFLTAFGLEAKDATNMANQMAYAQSHSNTSTQQLGEAFGNCAAQMHTAGQTMETTTAFLEAMANQSLKGSEAGTALAAVMRDITQKMEDGAITIGDTSVAVMDQNGNFRNLIDIMADVEKATDGMGTAEKSAALMNTFTARSIKAVSMGLTEGTDKLYSYEAALGNVDGAAGDMANTMLNNLNGQLTLLKSAIETLLIQIGDILMPKFKGLVSTVKDLVDRFTEMKQEQKEQVLRWLSIAAAIGPVLLILGKLTSGIAGLIIKVNSAVGVLGSIAEAFGIAGGAGGALSAILGTITSVAGPILAVAAAVAVLVKGLQSAYESSSEIREEVARVVTALQSSLQPVIEFFTGTVIPGFQTAWENFQTMIQPLTDFLNGFFASVWRDVLIPILQTLATDVIPPLQSVLESLWNNVLVPLGQFLQAIFTPVFRVLGGVLTGLWHDILAPIASAVIPFLGAAFHALCDIISGVVLPIFGWLADKLTWVATYVIQPLADIVGGILVAAFRVGGSVIGSIISEIVNVMTNLIRFVTNVFTGNWKGAWESILGIVQSVFGIFTGIIDGFKKGFNTIIDAGKAVAGIFTGGGSKGSHADGIAYVPYNGYRATLHEGERVLTRNEAKEYDSGPRSGNTFNFYSPKALDPYESNKLFKETVRKMEEGFA